MVCGRGIIRSCTTCLSIPSSLHNTKKRNMSSNQASIRSEREPLLRCVDDVSEGPQRTSDTIDTLPTDISHFRLFKSLLVDAIPGKWLIVSKSEE